MTNALGLGPTNKVWSTFTVTLLFYLRTWSFCALSPGSIRKRNTERSDSIRSMGFRKDHKFNVRWLRAARRVLKPDGTLWVTGTHHIILSLGFALQRLGFRIITLWRGRNPIPLLTPSIRPLPTTARCG